MSKQDRAIPSISADGATVSAPESDYDRGDLMSARHGGLDVLYGRQTQDVLQACTPLPPRLLLTYAVQTRRNRRESALGTALAIGMFAMIPAVIALGLLSTMGVRDRAVLAVPLVPVAILMIRMYFKEVRSPANAWQLTRWLDFESCQLHLRKSFFDRGLLPVKNSIPFAELTLVCYPHHWEVGTSFDVGLCRKDQMKMSDSTDPPCLSMIHSSEDEAAAHQFATALAAAWGMECRARIGGQWSYIAKAKTAPSS